MSSRKVDHSLLEVTGYTDRLSAYPGESIRVHASSIHSSGSLQIVRLGHDGTNFTQEAVGASQPIALTHQRAELDSYGVVDTVTLPTSFAISTWVWISLLPPEGREANLLAIEGLVLTLETAGTVSLRIGHIELRNTTVLQRRRWYHVSVGVDTTGRSFVEITPQKRVFGETPQRARSAESVAWKPFTGPLEFGRGLDGKLEAIQVSRSQTEAESGAPGDVQLQLDFAQGISTWSIYDVQGNSVGHLVGLPKRAVQGRFWNGSEHEWRHAPHQYAAIYFHSDSQGDQRWPVTATVELPASLGGGVYAVELSAAGQVDRLPFVVRRKTGEPAPLVVLLPTLTYATYSFQHGSMEDRSRHGELCALFAHANGYHSLYDSHADGAPVVLASLHRPMLNLRPDHVYFQQSLHGLSADLHLLGWLARQGFSFDVITDHDLDADGVGALAPYRAVLTGHHPEYWTARMFDALEGYLDAGGNLAYLGGNGFYWSTLIDHNDPSVVELRRGPRHRFNARGGFTSQLEGDVGEEHFQLTGAPGGVWSTCGRMIGALAGVVHACGTMKEGHGAPYRRTPASFDPRVAHLFVGIGDDELIGDHGAIFGGAVAFEVDFAHPLIGTPAHALIVATGQLPEDADTLPLPIIQPRNGDYPGARHADLTYFETPAGGAVLSVGSMGWIGALAHDSDRNAVSRLTGNALLAFIAAEV